MEQCECDRVHLLEVTEGNKWEAFEAVWHQARMRLLLGVSILSQAPAQEPMQTSDQSVGHSD